MKILEDALAIEDAGCFMLEFEAVPAKIAQADLRAARRSRPSASAPAPARDGQILLCYDLLGVFTDFKPKFTKRFAQSDRGRRRRHHAIRQGSEGGDVPRRRPLLHGERGRIREVRGDGRQAQADLICRARQTAARSCRTGRVRPRRDVDRARLSRSSKSRSSRCGSSPGDVLSEQMLSASFKIGRTPIREALAAARARRPGHHPAAQGHPRLRHQSAQPTARAGSAARDRAPAQPRRRRARQRASSGNACTRSPTAWSAPRRRNDDIAFMRLDRELNR